MNRQAFESVPVPSTRITDIYLIAQSKLNEHWDGLVLWASEEDRKAKEEYEARKAEEERKSKEKIELQKKYYADLAAWEKASRFTRGDPPKDPYVWGLEFLGLRSDPYWYRTELYQELVSLKMEIETMLQAAKEAEVVKLDQPQFLRMMKFNDDKVVSEWIERMKA